MAPQQPTRRPLKGSERQPLSGARAVGKADPDERLEVTVVLRRRNVAALTERAKKLARRGSAGNHLSREQFDYQFVGFFFNDAATTEIYTLSLHDAAFLEADR